MNEVYPIDHNRIKETDKSGIPLYNTTGFFIGLWPILNVILSIHLVFSRIRLKATTEIPGLRGLLLIVCETPTVALSAIIQTGFMSLND